MKIAYFDCFAGAAGDMIVAAMLDAGLEVEFLKAQIATLGIENLDIKSARTIRAGLEATSFVPVIGDQQHHRNLKQITEIISQSKISEQAKKTAITIFNRLAEAEAVVHGKAADEVTFHELGALDSIVDIVSASVGLMALGVEKVFCSALSVGGGSVKCTHGILPVPAPATAELLKGVPIVGGPAQIELLTPTAAAILTTVAEQFGPLPAMRTESVGYGAGTFQSEEFPNVLRLILGRTTADDSTNVDSVCLLETNIDDASGELVGSVTEQLLGRGVLDVFTTPICMKHNRPAVQVSVICRVADAAQIEQMLFEQGLTFGIRKQILQRSKLVRDFVTVTTEFGKIRIKTGSLDGKVVVAKPEFSDCVLAAKEHNQSVKAVLDAAMAVFGR
jgi:hypothetical protein